MVLKLKELILLSTPDKKEFINYPLLTEHYLYDRIKDNYDNTCIGKYYNKKYNYRYSNITSIKENICFKDNYTNGICPLSCSWRNIIISLSLNSGHNNIIMDIIIPFWCINNILNMGLYNWIKFYEDNSYRPHNYPLIKKT